MAVRVVKVRRISREEETSAALVAQDQRIERECSKQGYAVVGDAEDGSVSGAVPPSERKGLGPWMREPLLSRWDKLIFDEQDRVGRDDIEWWRFVGWVRDLGPHRDIILLDHPGFSVHDPERRMLAGVKSGRRQGRQAVATHHRPAHIEAHQAGVPPDRQPRMVVCPDRP
ncbi:recombinase family protein [Streptomyces sp. NPDC020607]|uniref:recombinase family protein n=1 Tax=Streptomyces sp. NPDC020607 TaxID=3365082 RepID=UPI003792DC49